ncbi:MAG: NfeD family protein [Ruminococcaceae bacterium]|nr:NfeD family protein [Oscillospiraceae bacterium]
MLYLWIALFVIFLITEAVTAQLATIWFAAGALVALILELAGVESIAIQVVVFLAVSAVTLIATRPLVKKMISKKAVATNADRNVGCEAVVTEAIDNLAATGAVKINGNVWTARSVDDSPIEAGTIVITEKIDGVKMIVRRK